MENIIFGGPRNKAWISEWGDKIRNSPQVGPVAVSQKWENLFFG